MAENEREVMVKVGISFEGLVAALREMEKEDREWFLENLLAATSPEYLKSVEEARQDYRKGRTVEAEELFRDWAGDLQACLYPPSRAGPGIPGTRGEAQNPGDP